MRCNTYSCNKADGNHYHLYNHTDSTGGCATSVKTDTRHFESGNYLYADGHVKWKELNSLKAADWTLQDD